MVRQRHVLKRNAAEPRHGSRNLLTAGALVVAGCSLQDLGYLAIPEGQDGGLSGSLNTSGAGGNAGRGGSGNSNGGNGGTAQGGSGGSGASSGEGGGGSGGDGGSGSGGTTGGGGAGGSAGTAPVNYGGSAGYLGTGTLSDGGPDGNLIEDPGFESGYAGWVGQGSPTLSWSAVGPAAGAHCLRTSNRTVAWMGPLYSLKDVAIPGESYALSAYVRVSHPNEVKFSLKTTCQGAETAWIDVVTGPAGIAWRLFEGTFTVPTCTLIDFGIEAEQAPHGVEIFLDEVRVVPVP